MKRIIFYILALILSSCLFNTNNRLVGFWTIKIGDEIKGNLQITESQIIFDKNLNDSYYYKISLDSVYSIMFEDGQTMKGKILHVSKNEFACYDSTLQRKITFFAK